MAPAQSFFEIAVRTVPSGSGAIKRVDGLPPSAMAGCGIATEPTAMDSATSRRWTIIVLSSRKRRCRQRQPKVPVKTRTDVARRLFPKNEPGGEPGRLRTARFAAHPAPRGKPMARVLVAYAAALVAICACDFVWLGAIAPGFYQSEIGALLLRTPNWIA